MPSSKSKFMQRCVGDVAGQGKELGSAFAICTAQSQKSGYSEPGTSSSTAKGKARDKFFGKQPDMAKKSAAYEKAVKAGRKSEDMAAVFARLDEGVLAEESAGRYVLDKLLPSTKVRKIGKIADPQTGELAMQVWAELVRRIDSALGQDGADALMRLINVNVASKDDTGVTRNQVFKAANSLGLKLPSYMF